MNSAISQSSHNISVVWEPFLLRGDSIPEGGVDKGGSPETRVPARMKEAGARVGIDFTGKCDKYPNSLSTHALLKYTHENSPMKQNVLSEILFRQYFTDGLYSNGENLKAAAVEAGLDDPEAAAAYAENPANKEKSRQEALANSKRGVSGVPFFLINGDPIGSGAQPAEAFLEYFEEA